MTTHLLLRAHEVMKILKNSIRLDRLQQPDRIRWSFLGKGKFRTDSDSFSIFGWIGILHAQCDRTEKENVTQYNRTR